MTLYFQDNIVAIATPPQNGPIGIIRLSGPRVQDIIKKIFQVSDNGGECHIAPRRFYFGHIQTRNGQTLDRALIVYFKAPYSFTGEDVVELHCHGNLILLRSVIGEILGLSDLVPIRAADPGEFTKRAYLNGKLDLTQAEAVHQLINAQSEAGMRLSLSNMDGHLTRIVGAMTSGLKRILALIEASFEFPEEDIKTFDPGEIIKQLQGVRDRLYQLQKAHFSSRLYDQGVRVALVGPPNVGKSSLLNAIILSEKAIVTDIPGTTRDVVEDSRVISGVRYIFQDTAGMRETQDRLEEMGIQKTAEVIKKADLVFYVSDRINAITSQLVQIKDIKENVFHILNKIDLHPRYQELLMNPHAQKEFKESHHIDLIISAKTGFGIDEIEKFLENYNHAHNNVHNLIHINERQHNKITECSGLIQTILTSPHFYIVETEILAEEIRHVISALQEITGEISSEDVLEEIFKNFCIGK